ncbi:MAG: NifU family protein [Rickettsiales bacterium]|jgi:Fe-S cluster biogenesis protein NfuA|nr:NifU family protein [Rickettsiales bacterium]
MFIQTFETPNPSTLKFTAGMPIMKKGTAAFAPDDDLSNSPLAQKLFQIDSIQGIFFGSDFIAITKAEDIEWEVLKPEIIASVMDHLVAGLDIIIDKKPNNISNDVKEDDSEIVKQIKELLEERVRPAVAMDGGDIIFHNFEEGVVYLEMHGACSGCPSSTETLKGGIENMLKHYIPEIVRVEAVEA